MKLSTDIIELLQHLDSMQPLAYDKKRSPWEFHIRRLQKFMAIAAFFLFFLLSLLAALAWIFPEIRSRASIQLAAFVLYVLINICTIAILLPPIVAELPFLFSFKKKMSNRLLLDAECDLAHVECLQMYPHSQLLLAHKWKNIQIGRIDDRISLFIGSREKIALIVIVGLTWNLWKEIASLQVTEWNILVQLGLALIGGIVAGAMLMRSYLPTLTYHRDLLDMAIALMDIQQKPTDGNTTSPVIVP